MKNDATILIAEDDDGHAGLLTKNFRRAGLRNKTMLFSDGEEILEFLFGESRSQHVKDGEAYVLILDIRMPKVDGIEVLRQVKKDKKIRPMPVIIFTTTFDPDTVKLCQELGCSKYLVKPTDYDKFIETIKQLGILITAMEVPRIIGTDKTN
ncbi:MAG: response regulator [Nitrospirae bacterium]|nr:response regulator [Nitrospirota bacterium]